MKARYSIALCQLATIILAASCSLCAQVPNASRTPSAASAPTVVPALIPYNGTAESVSGKPLALSATGGELAMTFLLFKDQLGGEPLWVESQMVALGAQGHYQVQLGASSPSGLPLTTFASGEGRWLEVQISGQAPQPRVLLMSVPYAMKAADASTLGGLPASAFMLAGAAGPVAATDSRANPEVTPASTVTTPGGTAGYLSAFSGAASIDDSVVFQSGTKIGIGTNAPATTLDVNGPIDARGLVTVESAGTAISTAGKNSEPIDFVSSAFSSTTSKATSPLFQLQSEASGNNTTAPTATLNLLYGNGAIPAETGFSISSKGLLTFAGGQKFPGTGAGTITGITTASPLSGAGTTGSVALSLNTAALETTLNSKYAQLGAANTFSGANTFAAPVKFAASQTFPGTGKGTITDVTAGTGLTGGGTTGAITLGLDTTNIPTLTDNPVFSGTITANSSVSGSYALKANGANGAGGVYATSTTAGAGNFSNSAMLFPTVFSTNSSNIGGWAFYGKGTGSDGTGIYTNESGVGGYGVEGIAEGAPDINGNPSVGVLGEATSGNALVAVATTGTGVQATTTSGVAVRGTSTTGISGYFTNSSNQVAVLMATNFTDGGGYNIPVSSYGYAGGALGIGVRGVSAQNIGVQGTTGGLSATGMLAMAEPNMAGVWGDSARDGSNGHALGGVAGFSDNNAAAYFQNKSSKYSTLELNNLDSGPTGLFKTLQASTDQGTCGFGGKGDLTCTGQVKSLATTGGGARMVETYAMQSPENWMEDFGSGSLQNGVAMVTIESAFAETVSATADYHVFLTPRGDCKGLYVTKLTATSFEVHESGGGTSALGFDYRIVAKRRGFESQRMVDVTESYQSETARSTLHRQIASAARPQSAQPLTAPVVPELRMPRAPQTPQSLTLPVAMPQAKRRVAN